MNLERLRWWTIAVVVALMALAMLAWALGWRAPW